jgi:hypothetical protein
MNAVWLVILTIFALWGFLSFLVILTDHLVKLRYDQGLEMRDWDEKVQAMRRLHEMEEGDL